MNPVDALKTKGESLHKYGNYLMSCLPKYIQQYVMPSCNPAHGCV